MGSITHAKVVDTTLNPDWSQTQVDAQIAAGNLAAGTTPADIALASDFNEEHVFNLDKSDVGLSNVDNTSDADKPISTATQAALDAKQPLDGDLTAIAGLSPSNDDVIQRKAGAWTNRTVAQLKTDFGLATVATSGSAADLSTGTLPAGRMPALTGDVTTSAGAVATTLATVNANVGSFTNANITVNAKGLITAASNGSGGGSSYTDTVTASPSSSQNDYNPTGYGTARTLRLTPSTSINLTGLSGGASARVLTLVNASTSYLVNLLHESGSSSAANRLFVRTNNQLASNFFLLPGQAVTLVYDSTSSRWRLEANTTSGTIQRGGHRFIQPNGNMSTANESGIGNPATSRTVAESISTGSIATVTPRLACLTDNASAGSTAFYRESSGSLWRGNAAGMGGFFVSIRFGFYQVGSSGIAFFFGLNNGSAIGNVNPSSLENMICVGKDPTQTTLRLMVNTSGGTAVSTDLGASFPVNTSAVYEFVLFCEPNGSEVQYCVTRLDDQTVSPAIGSITSNLPGSTSLLGLNFWCGNRADSVYAGWRLFRVDVFTPY